MSTAEDLEKFTLGDWLKKLTLRQIWGVIGVLGILLAGAFSLGSYLTAIRRDNTTVIKSSFNADQMKSITAAREKGRPYVITSVTLFLRFNDERDTRRASVRTIYTLLALKDISEDEAEAFIEQYTANGVSPKPWYGTNREERTTDPANFSVRVSAKEGDVVTVVTGANFEFSLPMAARQAMGAIALNAGDPRDYWSYPTGQDFIWDFTMLFESNVPLADPTAYTVENGIPRPQAMNPAYKINRGPGEQSISANWKFLTPGKDIGIIFTPDRTHL